MLEKYGSYQNKWQIHMGREGRLCGWKGIGCVRNVPSDSHRGLLTENTRQFCSGCLYHPSYPSTQCVTAPEQRWWKVIQAPDPVTHQSCLELPISRQGLANCTTFGMAEFFILTSSGCPCYEKAGIDLKLECFASKSTSYSSQGCQWPFKTFVPQFLTCNPWITPWPSWRDIARLKCKHLPRARKPGLKC